MGIHIKSTVNNFYSLTIECIDINFSILCVEMSKESPENKYKQLGSSSSSSQEYVAEHHLLLILENIIAVASAAFHSALNSHRDCKFSDLRPLL